jgi:putative Holliday junction resolvase
MTETPSLLAFDVGEARVGLARSTALGLGEPVTILRVKGRAWSEIEKEIAKIVEEFGIEGFVVGLPRNMDGSLGPQARYSEEFAQKLGRSFPGIPVVLEDERLSTEEAYERLAEIGVRGRKAKERVDAVAACVILESSLQRRKKL